MRGLHLSSISVPVPCFCRFAAPDHDQFVRLFFGALCTVCNEHRVVDLAALGANKPVSGSALALALASVLEVRWGQVPVPDLAPHMLTFNEWRTLCE